MTVAELIAYLDTKEPSTPVVINNNGKYVPVACFREFLTKDSVETYSRRDNPLESGSVVIVVR